MMQDLEISEVINKLQGFDEWRIFVEYVEAEREGFVRDLRQAETPHDAMKLAGSIATLSELLDLCR